MYIYIERHDMIVNIYIYMIYIYIYIYIRTRIYIHISSCVYRHVGNQLFQHHFMKLSFESLYIHDLSIKHVGNTGMLTFTCDGFCAGKPNP